MVGAEAAEETDQAGLAIALGSDVGHGALQRFHAGAGLVLHLHLEAAGAPQAVDRRSAEEDGLSFFYVAVLLPQPGGNPVGAQLGMAGTFVERSEDDKHAADIGNVGAGENGVAGHADRVRYALGLQSEGGHARDHLIAALQA